MPKTLLILEVSKKQDYIFAKKELKENAARSEVISFVTNSAFFEEAAPELYVPEKNMVYSGGGHTVLQFGDREQAKSFAAAVTGTAMKRYEGLELFARLMEYDEGKTPSENLIGLSEALERKKSLRAHSFKTLALGLEAPDRMTHRPGTGKAEQRPKGRLPAPPEGWNYPADFETLAGTDNFIAVVHADGNAMGNRVNGIYQSGSDSWEDCCGRLRRFSEGIQRDFETAFTRMVEELICQKDSWNREDSDWLPVRPIILAGDDVCFAARGRLGLECARIFLEQLAKLKNQEDGLAYSACAGVAMIHTKLPFHRAYDLAEELCSSAKKFSSRLDENRTVSAMDWHIEFGQLKDDLAQHREDYETEDGKRMELRPVTVVIPENVPRNEETAYRSWDFFRAMCSAMKGEYGKIARSKIKDLRNAMKQGQVETEFFLRDREIGRLLYHGLEARYTDGDQRWEQFRKMMSEEQKLEKKAFVHLDQDRCLFFDAIELIDHCEFLKEAEK